MARGHEGASTGPVELGSLGERHLRNGGKDRHLRRGTVGRHRRPPAGPWASRDGTGEQLPLTALPGGRRWAVLVVLCLSLLVVALDNTILNVALPTLVRELHATDSQLQWIVDGYTIVFAGLMITFGSLGDRVGRRGVLIIGLAVFGTGSALSAFSSSAGELIAFRCIMGVGGALVMPSTLSILTNVFISPKERARAIGIWSGTSGLGVALGPIIGGWLLAHFWWGSVFLVNTPIVAAGLVAVALLVPTSKDPAARRLDPGGTVLSIAGLGLLLWGIIEAPVDGWGDKLVIGALTGGVVLIAAFVSWEMRTDHPMFRMDFFANARFSAASVSVSLVFFALFGAMFLLTQYLQSVLGYTPLEAGVRIAPVALTLAIAAPLAVVCRRAGGHQARRGHRPWGRGARLGPPEPADGALRVPPGPRGHPRRGDRHGHDDLARHGGDHGLPARTGGGGGLGDERHQHPDRWGPWRGDPGQRAQPALPRRTWPRYWRCCTYPAQRPTQPAPRSAGP